MHRRKPAASHAIPAAALGIILALFAVFALAPALRADLPKLMSRDELIGGRAGSFGYAISPDGTRLAYLGPSGKGARGVWVRTPGRADARFVSSEIGGMSHFDWAYDNRHLLFLSDTGEGREDFHLFAFDLETGKVRDLTPFAGVKGQNLQLRTSRPDEVLIGLNRRDRRYFDMYRVNLKTFEITPDVENPGDVRWWLADDALVVRAAVAINPKDGSTILRVRDGAAASWRDLFTWPFGESGLLEGYGADLAIAFAPDGKSLYVQAAFKNDWTELVLMDAATGKVLETIFSDPKAPIWNIRSVTLYDYAQVLIHPTTGRVQAVGVNYLIPEWRAVDPEVERDFAVLRKACASPFTIGSRDLSGDRWVVNFYNDNKPGACFYYDRKEKKATLLARTRENLSPDLYAAMRPAVVKSRDGWDLPCYLTLPVGVPAKGLPLIMHVHGGPWTRDEWGCDLIVQWLANRGYAVMQVNFRGSSGYGKRFLNAGTRQWGQRMNDDVADAVRWAVAEGIADPKRVGITGASYGGYATLAAAAFTPDLYACAVAECGIYNVRTFAETMPSWWQPIKIRWLRRIGDVLNDETFNRKISPHFHGEDIKARLLIIHGENDPRVNIRVANEFVDVVRKGGGQVQYVVYPGEGHGIGNFPNLMDMLGREEEFLAKHLGGRFEPWKEMKDSTVHVK